MEGQEARPITGSSTVGPRSGWLKTEHQNEECDTSGTFIAGIVVEVNEHEVSPLHIRDTLEPTIATCLSPEIAESDDGNPVDNRNNKRSYPFAFDVFAEDEGDDDGLASEGQRPPKRFLRNTPSPTGIHEVRTPLITSSRHDAGFHTDVDCEKESSNDHEDWQAQRIIGERQTSTGLEFEVSVHKTL
jgi:hypothetical protein